jgi:hypothetical protein
MLNALLHELQLLPLVYGVIVLCVVSTGVIARLLSQNLISVAPDQLRKYLSISLDVHTSGETFIENFLDHAILLNLRRELLKGNLLLNSMSYAVSALCPQRDGVVSIREQQFTGKYWSGTEP